MNLSKPVIAVTLFLFLLFDSSMGWSHGGSDASRLASQC